MSGEGRAAQPDGVRISEPWNGDILNRHDGSESAQALTVQVRGEAPEGASVSVNGLPAQVQAGAFCCQALLRQRENELVAVARRGGAQWQEGIRVLWDRGSRPRYRFSVDDNIEFLKDLGTRPDDYPSLFDHWYLAFWRRMHEEFGAKIHINIYYRTVAGDFQIARMPDRWKEEWQANSPWLHLTFHALQDKPDRIYRQATYSQMAHDFDLVVGEIRRFAGEAVLSQATTVHWAEAPKEACRALHDRGIRVLIGIFRRPAGSELTTGYYLPETIADHIAGRDCWYDAETDLTFVDCDAVVNHFTPEQVEPHLDRQGASPHTAELVELLIHEQYFRKELRCYQPDVQERVARALRWVTERGYEPVFWGDGFLGNPAMRP